MSAKESLKATALQRPLSWMDPAFPSSPAFWRKLPLGPTPQSSRGGLPGAAESPHSRGGPWDGPFRTWPGLHSPQTPSLFARRHHHCPSLAKLIANNTQEKATANVGQLLRTTGRAGSGDRTPALPWKGGVARGTGRGLLAGNTGKSTALSQSAVRMQ